MGKSAAQLCHAARLKRGIAVAAKSVSGSRRVGRPLVCLLRRNNCHPALCRRPRVGTRPLGPAPGARLFLSQKHPLQLHTFPPRTMGGFEAPSAGVLKLSNVHTEWEGEQFYTDRTRQLDLKLIGGERDLAKSTKVENGYEPLFEP